MCETCTIKCKQGGCNQCKQLNPLLVSVARELSVAPSVVTLSRREFFRETTEFGRGGDVILCHPIDNNVDLFAD